MRVAYNEPNLLFSQCRDCRGEVWTSPVAVASATIGTAALVCLDGGYGVVYTKLDGTYWKMTADPDAWSGAEMRITQDTEAVQGVAVNEAGVAGALVGRAFWMSADRGGIWLRMGDAPIPEGVTSLALGTIGGLFVLDGVDGGVVKHWVSEDCGKTWR